MSSKRIPSPLDTLFPLSPPRGQEGSAALEKVSLTPEQDTELSRRPSKSSVRHRSPPPAVPTIFSAPGVHPISRLSTFDSSGSSIQGFTQQDAQPHVPAQNLEAGPLCEGPDGDGLGKKSGVRFTPSQWETRSVRSSVGSTRSENPQENPAEGGLKLRAEAVNPTVSPGAKMVRCVSGERLKPDSAYRRSLDGAMAVPPKQQAGGGYPKYVVPTLNGKNAAPDEGGDSAGLAADADFATITAETTSSAVIRRREAEVGIPFWIRVCLMMLIPVLYIAIYLGMTFSESLTNIAYVDATGPIISNIVNCPTNIEKERRRTTDFQLATDKAQRKSFHADLVLKRLDTDNACGGLVDVAQKSPIGPLNQQYLKDLRAAFQELDLLRYSVDRGLIDTITTRARFSDVMNAINNGLMLAGKGSVITRRYVQLLYFFVGEDRLGLCGAAVVEALTLNQNRTAGSPWLLPKPLAMELNDACLKTVTTYLYRWRVACGNELRSSYDRWSGNATATTTLSRIQAVAGLIRSLPGFEDSSSSSNAIVVDISQSSWAADDAPLPAIDFDMDSFRTGLRITLSLMDDISYDLMRGLVQSQDLRDKALEEGLKLFLTVFVSLIGIVFLGRAQQKASAKVDFALSRTRQMSRAVGAFIPRSFLKLMGVDSILHLERGDQTEVSVALVFSDIRNFTGISEHMTNEQLFEWLQAHLTRMTTTTERHRGFVDKFVGDAVSSVFLDCGNAVRCAVRMQAVTDALCYELIANNQDHLVRIGVGIHYACVGIGVLGNDKHHSCSIVSSEIAVPAQLEALTKEYGARIIITEQVADLLKEGEFENRVLGRVRLSLHSEKEYRLYEIYAPDALEVKQYKQATAEKWDKLVEAQDQNRLSEMGPLVAELEQAAIAHNVTDLALQLKGKASKSYDQFDMD